MNNDIKLSVAGGHLKSDRSVLMSLYVPCPYLIPAPGPQPDAHPRKEAGREAERGGRKSFG